MESNQAVTIANEWYGLHSEETFTGWNVIKRCPVCKDSSVFVHNAKNEQSAIGSVENRFNSIHLECNYNSSSAGESSAV